ncbi:hypothetical protein SAMN04488124_0113 [Halogeometricum limi]|uniref:Uncharacterized protein n=2 Tax=Halogeometricum limi TaxID=555875 RepID=A0A1I6FRG8_9EURY|nr:hypothetical protein SAMN04488124_0113 [Halogeometricum limi]
MADEVARSDESEPEFEPEPVDDEETAETEAEPSGEACHRRGCTEPAAFVVVERYQEETGQGAVEARAALCVDHTAEEGPTNLDHAYPGYVFRVEPFPETTVQKPE